MRPPTPRLLEAIGRGEFTINGFRNRDLRRRLFTNTTASQPEQRRQAAAVARKLVVLRAHHLIRKVPHTHRYHLTVAGRIAVTAMVTARSISTQQLTNLAA